jgi:Domain of unknown function (DUF5919)
MAGESVALRVLLRERHWTYATFCAEYDKVAKTLDPRLGRTWPSRAQFQRWLAGDLRRQPHPDACRVLEALFPGWTAAQLLGHYVDHQDAGEAVEGLAADRDHLASASKQSADQFQDVTAIYATRSEFISNVPPHTLFDNATSIRACGLSLNLICQQYSEQRLRRLIERGGSMQCLFLQPNGSAISQREEEENYPPGTLSDLTRINLRSLERTRSRLPQEFRAGLEIATYDETIRFNVVLVDDQIGIVQPYLPAMRGIESPTFVLERRWPDRGLFPVFEGLVSSLWTRARAV